MKLIVSAAIELLGVAAITYGFYLIAPFLAFIVGGLGLLVIARTIDPPKKVEVQG